MTGDEFDRYLSEDNVPEEIPINKEEHAIFTMSMFEAMEDSLQRLFSQSNQLVIIVTKTGIDNVITYAITANGVTTITTSLYDMFNSLSKREQ